MKNVTISGKFRRKIFRKIFIWLRVKLFHTMLSSLRLTCTRTNGVPFQRFRLFTNGTNPLSIETISSLKIKKWVEHIKNISAARSVRVCLPTSSELQLLESIVKTDHKGGLSPIQVIEASKRTLRSKKDNRWHNGNRVYSSAEVEKMFEGSMKDKTMYVLPYKHSQGIGVKITDSPVVVLNTYAFYDVEENVWEKISDDAELAIHGSDITVIDKEEEEFIQRKRSQ